MESCGVIKSICARCWPSLRRFLWLCPVRLKELRIFSTLLLILFSPEGLARPNSRTLLCTGRHISWPLAEQGWGSLVVKEDSRPVSGRLWDSLSLIGLPTLFPSRAGRMEGHWPDSSESGEPVPVPLAWAA